jgi:hypothetical protein
MASDERDDLRDEPEDTEAHRYVTEEPPEDDLDRTKTRTRTRAPEESREDDDLQKRTRV